VAHPRDKFDEETLPDPELNPLLNPVLAAHMGRWAEVYFTSPPEKRGQAVSDLIRELKDKPPEEPVSVPPIIEITREKGVHLAEEPSQPSAFAGESRRSCGACSADNSAEQKYCGMCGAPLQSSAPALESNFHTVERTSEAHWSEPQSSDYYAEPAAEPPLRPTGYAGHNAFEQEWSIPEEDLPSFAVESESVPYRYRLYIGVALVVLLAALVYMAWHGTPDSSGDASQSVPSRVIPAAPPRSPSTTAQQPAAPRSVLPTDRSADRSADRPPDHPRTTAIQTQNQPETNSKKGQAPNATATSPRIVQVAAESSAIPPAQSGAEELAMAEKYLRGNNQGAARDNREAAQWLWKAVGKGNLTATITLSDLYLRGDGVPKSCDQARLLLDAAARKGKASAADRLRNLQAFGCQ
jgi:hypothetical protein